MASIPRRLFQLDRRISSFRNTELVQTCYDDAVKVDDICLDKLLSLLGLYCYKVRQISGYSLEQHFCFACEDEMVSCYGNSTTATKVFFYSYAEMLAALTSKITKFVYYGLKETSYFKNSGIGAAKRNDEEVARLLLVSDNPYYGCRSITEALLKCEMLCLGQSGQLETGPSSSAGQ